MIRYLINMKPPQLINTKLHSHHAVKTRFEEEFIVPEGANTDNLKYWIEDGKLKVRGK